MGYRNQIIVSKPIICLELSSKRFKLAKTEIEVMLEKIKNIPILRFCIVSIILIFIVFLLLSTLNCLDNLGKSYSSILYDVIVGWLVGVIGGVSVILLYPGQQNKS